MTGGVRPNGLRLGAVLMTDGLELEIGALAASAKQASAELAMKGEAERNAALQAMADALRSNSGAILEANACDMAKAADAGTKDSLLDRLMLDEERIEGMASALEDLIALPDPVGVVQMDREMYNGIRLKRVSVPLGVVAMVYEARPNVTADAAGICIKSGNACVLRGGSMAAESNEAIAGVLSEAATKAGMPENSICCVSTTDRRATDVLMSLRGVVDVLIPRGGAGLISHCVEASKVPVIETGTGNCHVYLHESCDKDKAVEIVENAKCRRYGVCNAAETLLVDESVAADVLPDVLAALARHEVMMHVDDVAMDIATDAGIDASLLEPADESDWATEYLAPEIAVRCVGGVREAIDHVNKYGTKHSESIVAEDSQVADLFCKAVDAAAVYVNASTAFTDGGQFGLGAEIGISTQKIHARGPFALDALTSYKYVLHGDGQTRA